MWVDKKLNDPTLRIGMSGEPETMPSMNVPTCTGATPTVTECKGVLLSIAGTSNGDVRLVEMRNVFETMHRSAETDDDASEIVVVGGECLWRAARAGNTGIMTYLLRDRQIDPNARRALHYAARYGNTEAARLLIAHGAVP